MLSAPAPTPPPHPPPIHTDSRVLEPDEQWKADLRRRVEHELRHMVEEARTVRDAIFNSQPPESSRERAQREFEESMNNIRSLAQEQFTSQLRLEMNERKWALDLVDSSNSPEVVQQQQILDSIHKPDEQRPPFTPHDALQNSEEGLSIIPRQQGDSERGSDESFEEGYRSGGTDDQGDGSDESTGEEDEEEEGEEGRGERDTQPRHSRPHSRSNTLIQALHSRSPVSRKNFPSRQRQPLNFQPGEDNDEEEAEDPQGRPGLRHGAQPFPPGAGRRQSSSSQASVWPP